MPSVLLETATTTSENSGINIEEIWQLVQDKAVELAPNILAALAILVLGYFGAKIATAIFGRLLRRAKVEATIASFISKLGYIALMAFIGVAALGKLGVETGSFIAIVGAAGLAVGLALQGSLANFAAGVLLILFRPFKVGDVVQVAGEIGKVKEIEVFATTILRPDNKRVIIPNSAITGGNIVNFSAEGKLRVDLVASISYSDNIKTAKDVLMKVCEDHPSVLKDPAPTVGVVTLGASSVDLFVRPWCASGDYGKVLSEITEAMKVELEKAGCSIPFPQQDVHMHQVA